MSTVDPTKSPARLRVEEKTIVFANEPAVVLFDDSESDWHPTVAYTPGKDGEDIREVLQKARSRAEAERAPTPAPEPEPERRGWSWLAMAALLVVFASAGVGTGFAVMRASSDTVRMPTGNQSIASQTRVPLWSEDPVARGLHELDRMNDR